MKRMFRRITAAVIGSAVIVSGFSTVSFANGYLGTGEAIQISSEAPSVINAGTYDLDLPSKQEIKQKYYELGMNNSELKCTDSGFYSSQYSGTSPYSPGELSSAVYAEGLNTVNFVRYVAGLPSVSLNDTYCEYTQAASLVNYVNGSLSHYPVQPSDMDDALYSLGSKGAGSSNIGYGYLSLRSSILNGYMEDGDSGNISRVGHRRWILNPSMSQTGFGYAGGYGSGMTAMYAFDRNRSEVFTGDYVAWPAANTPYEIIPSTTYPFSVSLGSEYDTPVLSEVSVTLKAVNSGNTWIFNSSNSSYPNNYFNVETGGYGINKCIIFSIGQLSKNETYRVTVNGIYKDGVEAPISYTANIFTLDTVTDDPVADAPTGFSATAGNGEAKLIWNKVSGAVKYRLQHYGTDGWTTIAYPTTNSYTVTGLINGGKYVYRVLAYANGVWSEPSAKVLVTPVSDEAPKNLRAVAGNGSAQLSWTAVGGAVKYRLQHYGTDGWTTIAYPTTNSYTVTGLKNGGKYVYRVLAYTNAWSQPSAKVMVIPAATASSPKNLTATAGNGQVTLKWNSVSGAVKYRLQHYGTNGWTTIAYPTTNSHTVTGLKNGGKYVYRVLAYVNGAWSEPSAKVLAVPVAGQISAPKNVMAVGGDGIVYVRWDEVDGAVKYRVQINRGSGWTTGAYPTTPVIGFSCLTNNKTYSFRVLAYVNGQWSEPSEVVAATPTVQ